MSDTQETTPVESKEEAVFTAEPAKPICYIGKHGVEEATREGEFMKVKYTSGDTAVIHSTLFDRIVTPDPVDTGGEARDIVCANIAKELIATLMMYDVTLGDFQQILKMAENNVVHLKEASDAIKYNGRKFYDVTFRNIRDTLAVRT
jgi:hypothetical protein